MTGKSEHWWSRDPAIPALHTAFRAARNTYRRLSERSVGSVSDELLATARRNRNTAKREFNRAVAKAHRAADDELAAALDDMSAAANAGAADPSRHKLVWSVYKRRKRGKHLPLGSFPNADNTPPRDPLESLNNMARHLRSVSSLEGHASPSGEEAIEQEEIVSAYLRLINPTSDLTATPPFSLDDVVQASSSFKLNTALGDDRAS